jgi:hypothetical protein
MATPYLVVEPMKKFQAKILKAVSWLLGLRNGSVAWVRLGIDIEDEADLQPTINDIVKNAEENEANKTT